MGEATDSEEGTSPEEAPSEDTLRYGYISGWLEFIPYQESFRKVLNPELEPLAQAFTDNVMRVRDLGALMPELAFWTRVIQRVQQVAVARLGLPIRLPGRVRGAPEPSPGLLREFQAAYSEYLINAPSASEAWQDGCDLMLSLISTGAPGFRSGVEILFSSMLTETWAAVEALLTDLLVAAVNLVPDPLARNYLGTEKSIPVDVLSRYKFDLSRNMGSALQVANRFEFSSLSGIEKSYGRAFADQDTTEIFDAFKPEVGHLEAIRNLYAHRSGKVDETFRRRVAKSTILPELAIGEQLRLNGSMVSHYTGVSVELCMEVFAFVDRAVFVYRNPQKG